MDARAQAAGVRENRAAWRRATNSPKPLCVVSRRSLKSGLPTSNPFIEASDRGDYQARADGQIQKLHYAVAMMFKVGVQTNPAGTATVAAGIKSCDRIPNGR